MNPIPQVHPACDSEEPRNSSAWPMAPQSQAELGVSSNATRFPHRPDNDFYSWNHRWGSHQGAARSTQRLQPVTWAERTVASSPSIKKRNKTKTQTHNVAKLLQHLWPPILQELNRWQDSIPTFPSLGDGLRGGWHFPRGMPFWQVSPSTHFLSPPPTGLQPERSQRGEMTDSKAILQCQKKMYLAFFLFSFFLK